MFLLYLFLGIILWYVFRGLLFMLRLRRSTKRMFEQFQQGGRAGGYAPDPRERKGGWSAPAKKAKKKIDPEVGEYVRFTEEKVTQSAATDTSGNTTLHTETQVTDVEWEDLPKN